ncbi:HD domain-containing protein [Halanaeroarchaeum sulfurireducens]|uniref:HD family metal dependent phosphohydrolase n=1 Tax=Halanaeroarchaeum sulfurireducens TaxID=1604004 RepID=A0A0F7PF74_9EURY|nr:HD domain-containing protein [Halanaeroarchaeum sulfurireducens]AKH98169.1 HD family metal dependent phosphohydrolase [Halanaeroarchaeum sulfurireducens]ALG82563.1 HD family metal dependent phosphohydrolase [Halanaeroarchaeum sulfurireducens]
MTTVKDSVHDHIEVEGVAAALMDTAPVQRLRRVSQLGTVSLVYPSANHTRFEHSLGVYHLASRALDHLDIHGRRAETVRAAAILHDIGHGPFSHNVEDLIHRRIGRYHHDVDDLVTTGDVARALDAHEIDPDRVVELIDGEGLLGQLVAGELDVDRMDYLVRDAHHTGVPYGTIDHQRLVRALRFVDGRLVLDEGNVQTAESLLVARALMNPTVYNHHVARISKAMLRRATDSLIDETDVTAAEVRRMDDPELQVALRTHDVSAHLGERLADRRLYKRAVWAEMGDVSASFDDRFEADADRIADYEQTIADRAGVKPEHVVVDVQGEPSMQESTSRVLVNGDVRRLDEQSTLVRAIQVTQREQWRLGVYAPERETSRVGRAAEQVLGLETDGALIAENDSPGRYATLEDFGGD